MNERIYNRELERLRDPSRLELLEIERVVDLTMKDLAAQPATVLDVGTGTGVFAEAFSKRNCRISGIDINKAMINEAQRIVPAGDFKIGSAELIPFADQAFDIVFFGLVLHETDDLQQALLEARRVGRKRVVALEWPYIAGEKGPPLAHRLKPEEINRSAGIAGFRNIRIVPLQTLVLCLMEI